MLKNLMLAAAAIAVAMAFGQVQAADTKPIDVPAGELTVALETLAKQSGVEFVYEVQQLRGLQTKGVHGELTTEKAVAKLLEGTKLRVTMHESGAVLIAEPQASSAVVKAEAIGLGEANGPSVVQNTTTSKNEENQESAESKSSSEASAEASESSDTAKLDEIVVTAQKREEKLSDVPMSLAV